MVAYISSSQAFAIHKIQQVDSMVVFQVGLDQVILFLAIFHWANFQAILHHAMD
jgi:hypothetical protein